MAIFDAVKASLGTFDIMDTRMDSVDCQILGLTYLNDFHWVN